MLLNLTKLRRCQYLWLLLLLALTEPAIVQAQVYSATFNGSSQSWKTAPVGYGGTWKYVGTIGVGGTGGLEANECDNATSDSGFYAASPAIALTGGMTYRFRVTARCSSANRRNLRLAYSTSRRKNFSTQVLLTSVAVPVSFTNYEALFTPTASGNYFLIISGIEISNQYTRLHIDNVVLEQANNAPTVSITSPAAGSSLPWGPAVLQANAADADGSIAQVRFFEGATLLGTSSTSPYTIAYTFTAGSHTINAIATDNAGATATSAPIAFTQLSNTPPTAAFTAPQANSILPTGPTMLSVNATDADGTINRVEFYEGAALLGTDNTAPYTLAISFASGSHTVVAKAFDNLGFATEANVTFNSNLAPTVAFTAPAPNAMLPAGNATLAANATDADGTIDRVEFYEGTVLLGTDNTAPFQLIANFVSGIHSITATAFDNLGFSAQANVFFTANQAPTVSFTVPAAGQTGLEAGNVTLRAIAADADGSVDKVEFYADGQKIGEALMAPYTALWIATVGSHTVQVKAIDELGFATITPTQTLTVAAPVSQTLFYETFDLNLGQFFLPLSGTAHMWKYWSDSSGINKTNNLHNKLPTNTDYFSSPLVSLDASKEYNYLLLARCDKGATRPRKLVVAYNTVRSRIGAVPLDTLSVPLQQYVTAFYTGLTAKVAVPTTGNYYLVTYIQGDGYQDLYVENVGLERNIIPTVAITAPTAASINESSTAITLSAAASDDGQVKKVEFYDGLTKIGEDTSAPYSIQWASYLPGQHILTAFATDNRVNRTPSAPQALTINFEDGTLSKYVHYPFSAGIAPWSVSNATVQTKTGYAGGTGWWFLSQNAGGFVASPKLFLTAGQTYILDFRANGNGRLCLSITQPPALWVPTP